MARTRRTRTPRLLRRARQQRSTTRFRQHGHPALAASAPAPQPENPDDVGTHVSHRQPLAPQTPHPAPLARRTLRRQYPRQEPGALDVHAGIGPGGGRQRPSLPGLAALCPEPGLCVVAGVENVEGAFERPGQNRRLPCQSKGEGVRHDDREHGVPELLGAP